MTGTGSAPETDVPAPAWAPTDGVVGPRADRQVLVVGASPAGLAAALLLRAAGYDPVVLGTADSPAPLGALLSPAAVETLGALGVAVPLRDRGRRVDVAAVEASESGDRVDVGATAACDPERPSPLVVATPALVRMLDAELPDGVVRDRGVESVSRRPDGIAVEFDNGVREVFDVVVDAAGASGPLRRDGWTRDVHALGQFETVVGNRDGPGRISDVWAPDRVVQRLPLPGGRHLIRVTGSGIDGRGGGPGPIADRLPEAVGEIDRYRVRQVRLPDGDLPERWWGDGRIAYCGSAACPTPPASGAVPSTGITDALGFVSALSRDLSAPDAVGTYAAARAERLDSLRRAVADGRSPVTEAAKPPLGALGVLRAVSLEPFFGTAPDALAGWENG